MLGFAIVAAQLLARLALLPDRAVAGCLLQKLLGDSGCSPPRSTPLRFAQGTLCLADNSVHPCHLKMAFIAKVRQDTANESVGWQTPSQILA